MMATTTGPTHDSGNIARYITNGAKRTRLKMSPQGRMYFIHEKDKSIS